MPAFAPTIRAMAMLHRDHASTHDVWSIERWHAHPQGQAAQRFSEPESALHWLRGFPMHELRRLAAELLDNEAPLRATDAELQRQLAGAIVAGRLLVAPAFKAAHRSRLDEPDVDERLLRRLRTTGHAFHHEGQRYRIVDAQRWAALSGSDDECWQVLPHDEAQRLLAPWSEWDLLSVDERAALAEVQQRVPAQWHPRQPVAGLLVLRIVPIITLYRGDEGGDAALTPSQMNRQKVDEEQHWVQIELIDADDQPVPGETYRIELPGGEMREGKLDKQGQAYIGGLKQGGTCKVCFPDIDTQEWRAA